MFHQTGSTSVAVRYGFPALVGALLTLLASSPPAAAGKIDAKTAAAGLRQALEVGTARAAESLGRTDGYLGRPEVRIPLPDQLTKVGKALSAIGQERLVDDFVTSMNRAAESAAPLARDVFVDSIREMTFEDALRILRGSKHEATDYLRQQAGPRLEELFRPLVSEQLATVGATRDFNRLMESTAKLPFVSKPAFDLEGYVTDRALEGMFLMISREEEKIRADPLARTTDLLKQVFGSGAKKKGKRPWWKRLLGGG